MKNLNFNPNDDSCIKAIMKCYGDTTDMIFGKNENDEDITMSISKTSIITETFQKNGWIRTNIYTLKDGTIIREELYSK